MNTLFSNYTVLSFGYSDLIGIAESGGIQRVEKELQEYNLFSVLESCSKISITLLSGGFTDSLTQAKLLAGIFNDKSERLHFYEISRAKSQGTPWAIFNHQSLLTLVKLAMKNCKQDGGKLVLPNETYKLGYWILILNDECFAYESAKNVLLPVYADRERLRSALARYQFFHSSDRLPYRIGRYRWIIDYLRSHKPNKIDVEYLFKNASGVSLEEYTTVCYSLIVKWINLSTKSPDISKDWVTCKEVYFAKSKIKPEIIDVILDEITMDKSAFIKKAEESVSVLGSDSLFYNFLPFIWSPLVSHSPSNCFTCPSSEYLYKKSTDGLYRTIETDLRRKNDKKTRQNFSIAWGQAFEQYINICLKKSFEKKFVPNYRYTNSQEIDGIVQTDEYIFVIETKCHHWKYKAMITGEKYEMESTLKHLFADKGLKQIKKCIDELIEHPRNRINIFNKLIIPVLILPDSIPQDAYNRKMYEDVANSNNATPRGHNVMPFIILTAEEVEMIESIATSQTAKIALQILFEYSNLYTQKNNDGYITEAISLKNYIFHRGFEKIDKVSNNMRVMKLFNKVYNDVSIHAFGKRLKNPKIIRPVK